MEEKTRRPAGRPKKTKEGGRNMTLYLNLKIAEKLKELGGAKWITKKVQEELAREK